MMCAYIGPRPAFQISASQTNSIQFKQKNQMDFDLPSEPVRAPQPSTSGRIHPTATTAPAPGEASQEHKSWTSLYPIYIDAKASKQHRRVPKSKAVPWPTAYNMARECAKLGLRTHLEVCGVPNAQDLAVSDAAASS